MSEYWKSHYNNNADKFADSPLKQVDRTINGIEMGDDQLQITIDSVRQVLQLERDDRIVDLCCGNGLITHALAPIVQAAVGVDFSDKLIEHANRTSAAPNLRYLVADVTTLSHSFYAETTKVYMRDSVSCLDTESLLKVLDGLKGAPNISAIFIAGVPDACKLNVYYDDDRKMTYYKERELAGKPHIGNWWSRAEMNNLVEKAGLKLDILDQHPALASAFYRYDCLIRK